MGQTLEIEVRELKPELLNDYLTFFDKAFSDFPDWAGCYCGFYDTPDSNWDNSPKASLEHRTAKSERITSGNAYGLLAYLDNNPVGWCNAQPRRNFVNMRSYKVAVMDPEESVGSIMCFLVDPEHRGKGISNILLNAACEVFGRVRLKIVEGYPTTNPRLRFGEIPWAEANYKGPLTMYLKSGFTIYRQLEKFAIVRKQL